MLLDILDSRRNFRFSTSYALSSKFSSANLSAVIAHARSGLSGLLLIHLRFLRLYQLLTYFRPVFQYVTKFHSLDENTLAITGCLAGTLS